MKAIVCELNLPRVLTTLAMTRFVPEVYLGPFSVARLMEVPEPQLIGNEWVKVKTRYAAITRMERETINLAESGDYASVLAPYKFIMGHSTVGTVVEAGEEAKRGGTIEGLVGGCECGARIGQRVLIQSGMLCLMRDIPEEQWCDFCKKKQFYFCQSLRSGTAGVGPALGFNEKVGGAWSPYFSAHLGQLRPIPDNVTFENALLGEPFAAAIHAVIRNCPSDDQTVLVIGAMTTALCVVAALRVVGFKGRIIVIAKYPYQAGLARHFGADEIIEADENIYEAMVEKIGGVLYKPPIGSKPVLMGSGVDIVYECVGSEETLDNALRLVKPGGKIVLVITPSALKKKIDWSFVEWKELTICGSCSGGGDEYYLSEAHTCSYKVVLDWMTQGKLDLSLLLTHRFKLEDYKKALYMSGHKEKYSMIRGAFEFPE